MEFHEAANTFPLMTDGEFAALVDSIEANGQRQKIRLFEGKILDGRNRYNACMKLGKEPLYEEWIGTDPFAYVWDINAERRHLEAHQKALLRLKHNASQSDYEEKKQHAQLEANKARSEAAKERERTETGVFTSAVSTDTTLDKPKQDNRSRKQLAQQAKVSEATAARTQALFNAAPDLAEKVMDGEKTFTAAEKEARQRKIDEERTKLAQAALDIPQDDRWNISIADIQTYQTTKQFDFIITDPPYPKEYLYLYEILALRTTTWLKPSGLLIVMCGQSYLNQIYEMLNRYLSYYWTAAYMLPGQPTPLRHRQVNTSWKPLLMFTNGDYKGKIFGDVFISDSNEKDFHKWGQSVSGMTSIVTQICLPGQSIFDPFCGAGTTGIAAIKHGCLFDGIDIDEENVNISRTRIHDSAATR